MCDEESAELVKIFTNTDRDGNGTLEFAEVQLALKCQGYTDKQIRKFFNTMDADGDHKITLEEFLAALKRATPEEIREAKLREVFLHFDKNRDGTIDKTELKEVFEEMGRSFSEDEIKKMMDMADADQDGSLDYEEFVNHFLAHM